MGTETLRPCTPNGDETSIESQSPDTLFHWDKVDEASADDATTHLFNESGVYQRDLFNLPAHSVGSGTIDSIKIYFRIGSSWDLAYAKPSQKSGTTVTDGTEQTQTQAAGWGTKSQIFTTNPATGSAYTWDEIDALQIGLQLKGDYTGKCTQVYVEVNYSLGWSGKVSGVTNPAKVVGIVVADITKVMGVS